MNKPNWLPRVTEIQADGPEVGDRVTLHFDQIYQYMVTVEVAGVESGGFTGTVIAIFDRTSGAQVLGGQIFSLVGTAVSFRQPEVMATIRRPAS